MIRYSAALAILIFMSGCGQPSETGEGSSISEYDNSVVLTVGERTVTGLQLAPDLERAQGDSLIVNRRLDTVVDRLLLLQDAHERGYDSSRELDLYAYERQREQLQGLWLGRILDEKVHLPQDTVEEYYSQMGTMLVYQAITVSDSSLCDSLRQLVIDGADIGELAEQYSTISDEKTNRGFHGPIDLMDTPQWDFPVLRELEIGELSPIDSFRFGWRFVRIDSVFQDTVPDFEEIQDLISGRILGRMKMAYKEKLFDSLRIVDDLQISDGIPELIASHFSGNNQVYEPFTPEQEDLVAYSYNGGERTLYSLAENLSNLPIMAETRLDDPDWINNYCRLLGLYDIMAMEAKKLGMDTLPQVISYLDQHVGNQILDIYYSEVIGPRLVPGEEDLREIYEAEKDTLIVPEERVFKTIAAVGQEQLDILEQVMDSGRDPFSMENELTRVESILAPGESIITTPLRSSDIPQPWNEMLFSAGMNEIVTCSIGAEKVLVFELTVISPEHRASFEESQNQLTNTFKSVKEEEVIIGLVDSLSSVYHIQIDRDFVNRFIYADSLLIE